LKAVHASNLAKYCTPKKRVYVDGGFFFSPDLTYGDVNDSTLIDVELVSPTRVHLDFKCRWQTRRFVVMKKKSGWLLDSIKWKVSDFDDWKNGLIGS
jgi:hypothetical protein